MTADPKRRRYDPLISVTLTDGRRLTSDGDSEDYLLEWTSAVAMTRALGAEVGVPAAASSALVRTVEAVDRLDDLTGLIAVTRSCVRAIGEGMNAT